MLRHAAFINATAGQTLLFGHPDLSIAASHLIFLPFLQPMAQALNDSGRQVTAFVPAAAATIRQEQYDSQRFYGNGSEWRQSDACKSARAIVDVDQVVFN